LVELGRAYWEVESVLSPIDAAAVVDGFFRRAGIQPLLGSDEFWAGALKNYGDEAQQFKECLDSGGDRASAIAHQLMNSSLDFANLALSQFEARKLRAAAVWLLQGRIPAEGKVLELGCDSGLLLCLLASYYPETHFTGLDKGKETIQVAQERAAKLGLRNVKFKVGNVARGFAGTAGSGYRTVLSVTIFHEVLAERPMSASAYERYYHFLPTTGSTPAFSVTDLDQSISGQLIQHVALASIPKVLDEDGTFVSIERWPTIRENLKWIRLTEAHGLHVLLAESGHIEFESQIGDNECQAERLPATVFKKAPQPRPTAGDILGYCSCQQSQKAPWNDTWEDCTAELLYSALRREPAWSYTVEYWDGSGVENCEIGIASGLAYVYRTTSGDYRSITIAPCFAFQEQARSAEERFKQQTRSGAVQFRTYNEQLMIQLGLRIKKPS